LTAFSVLHIELPYLSCAGAKTAAVAVTKSSAEVVIRRFVLLSSPRIPPYQRRCHSSEQECSPAPGQSDAPSERRVCGSQRECRNVNVTGREADHCRPATLILPKLCWRNYASQRPRHWSISELTCRTIIRSVLVCRRHTPMRSPPTLCNKGQFPGGCAVMIRVGLRLIV
jgi:hypothetical protein